MRMEPRLALWLTAGGLALGAASLPAAASPIDTPTATLLATLQAGPLARAQAALDAGRAEEAAAAARAVIAAGGPDEAAAQELLGTALFLLDNRTGAVAALERAIALEPGRASALVRRGNIALADNELDAAQDYYRRALQAAPGEPTAHRRLGLVLQHKGDEAGAIREYRAAIAAGADAAAQDLAALLTSQGTAQIQAGDLPAALATLAAARAADPKSVRTLLALALAQRLSRQPDAALASLAEARKLAPNASGVHYQMGLVELSRQHFAEAQAALETARRIEPTDPAIRRSLAEALLLNGKAEPALALFGELATAPGAPAEDAIALGNAYQTLGRPADAEAAYRDAVRRYPAAAEAYLRLGAMLGFQRNYTEALKVLDDARSRFPDDPRLLRNIVMAQSRLGRTADAIATAKRMVEVAPASDDARFLLASLYQDAGRPGEAEPLYRQVLQDRPEDPWALNNLAALLTAKGAAAEAVSLAQRAAKTQPENADIADTLGWALLRANRAQDAVAALDVARRQRPDDPRILTRMATAQDAAGDRKAARENLAKALAIAPNDAAARALQAKLGK